MEVTGQQERWQLVGTAAEVYQQRLVPAIFEPWAPLVVDAASLGPGERVLDVACGTGVVAREAARRVAGQGSVVGLDNNAGMLDVARAIPSTPATSIEWREADAMAMPFPDAAFDVVLCQLGLQYFVDRLAVLREMRRVLTDDGRLVVLVWQSIEGSPGFALLAEALQRQVGTQAATIMRAPFGLGDLDELRASISEGGFHDVSVRAVEGTVRFPSARHFVEYQVAGSPLAGPVGDATAGAREALVGDVKAGLGPYQTNQGLAFPIAAHLAMAHA